MWGKDNIVKKVALHYGFTALLALTMMVGCATGGGGASDAEQVTAVINEWKAGLEGGDIDRTMATLSENFESADVGDKATMREFLEGAKDQGFLDDIEVGVSELEVTVDGDSATAYPVDLDSAAGAMTLEFSLTKEDGVWLITGSEQ